MAGPRSSKSFPLRDRQNRVHGGSRKLSNHALQLSADVARVVHEKPTVLRVLWVKDQSQKARLTAGSEAAAASDVQKWSAGAGSVALNDLDVPTLFDNEQPSTAVGRLLEVERCRESIGNLHQIKLRRGWRRRGRRSDHAGTGAATARDQ